MLNYSLNFYFVYPHKSGIYIKEEGILQRDQSVNYDKGRPLLENINRLVNFIKFRLNHEPN